MKTADNRLMVLAISTRAAAKVFRAWRQTEVLTSRRAEYDNAIDSLDEIAEQLEAATELEGALSDAELLEWVMEHTAAGHRNEAHAGMTHAVQWLDENGDEECTFSDSYRSAIRKAMGEGRASDAGSEVGT